MNRASFPIAPKGGQQIISAPLEIDGNEVMRRYRRDVKSRIDTHRLVDTYPGFLIHYSNPPALADGCLINGANTGSNKELIRKTDPSYWVNAA